MRRLLKIPLAGALATLVGMLIRRLLEQLDGDRGEGPTTRGGTPAANRAPAPPPRTREQLYREAARLEIRGRSKMNKAQLQDAVEMAKTGGRR
jgi:hypothetical protein